MGRAAVIVAVFVAACIPPRPPYDSDPNAHRSVAVLGCTIAPGKSSGGQWDGLGGNAQSALDELATLLAETPASLVAPKAVLAVEVAALLHGPLVSIFQPPDPWGHAELFVYGRRVGAQKLYKQSDTYEPRYVSPRVEWFDVDIRGARLRVDIIDIDAGQNDPIGTVDIDSESLLEAASSDGGRLLFRAAEQTNNQIVFVDLAVH